MRYLTSLLFLVFCLIANAQSYPKYKTTRVKDTVFTQPEKIDEIVIAETQLAEEPKSEFDELIRKGKEAFKEGDYKKSVSYFTDALNISTKDNEWYALECRGNTYVAMTHVDKASADFTRIIEENSTIHKGHLGYAHLMRACLALQTTDKEDDFYRCDDFKKAREYGNLSGDKAIDADCD